MNEKLDMIREECGNYYLYQKRIKEIDHEIEELRYEMNGVHAISYQTSMCTQNNHDELLIKWLDKQEQLVALSQEYKKKIKAIENWMEQVEVSVRFYVWMYCVEGMGIAQMAEQSGIHESNVFRILKKAMQEIRV